MTTANEGDTLSAINRAYREYYRRTGRKPTRIYVGRDEWIDLRHSGCAYVSYNFGNPTQLPEVLGMPVFEVCAQSHFYVC